MKPPVYSKRPPTRAGLYWYRVGLSQVDRFCRVWVQRDGKLVAGSNGVGKDVTLFDRRWAGPLPEPRP